MITPRTARTPVLKSPTARRKLRTRRTSFPHSLHIPETDSRTVRTPFYYLVTEGHRSGDPMITVGAKKPAKPVRIVRPHYPRGSLALSPWPLQRAAGQLEPASGLRPITDAVCKFVREHLTAAAGSTVSVKDAYSAYLTYCGNRRLRPREPRPLRPAHGRCRSAAPSPAVTTRHPRLQGQPAARLEGSQAPKIHRPHFGHSFRAPAHSANALTDTPSLFFAAPGLSVGWARSSRQ